MEVGHGNFVVQYLCFQPSLQNTFTHIESKFKHKILFLEFNSITNKGAFPRQTDLIFQLLDGRQAGLFLAAKVYSGCWVEWVFSEQFEVTWSNIRSFFN